MRRDMFGKHGKSYKKNLLEKKKQYNLAVMRLDKARNILVMISDHITSMENAINIVDIEKEIDLIEDDSTVLTNIAESQQQIMQVNNIIDARYNYIDGLAKVKKAILQIGNFIEKVLKNGKKLGY